MKYLVFGHNLATPSRKPSEDTCDFRQIEFSPVSAGSKVVTVSDSSSSRRLRSMCGG